MTDQAALTEVDALAWSADSGFPSALVPGARDGLFFTTESPPEAHLVAELDGSVVGYIRLKPPTRLPENAHVIQVQGLAVHPDARGHGAAGSLLDAAAKHGSEETRPRFGTPGSCGLDSGKSRREGDSQTRICVAM